MLYKHSVELHILHIVGREVAALAIQDAFPPVALLVQHSDQLALPQAQVAWCDPRLTRRPDPIRLARVQMSLIAA